MDLKKLIKEVLSTPPEKSCSCGCNTCDNKSSSPILNENLAPREILSEGLKYCIDNKKPLTDNLYRAGSKSYFNLWAEARALYSRGILEVKNEDDIEILTETHLGEYGEYLGQKIPLDYPMPYEDEEDENLTSYENVFINDFGGKLRYRKPNKAAYEFPNGYNWNLAKKHALDNNFPIDSFDSDRLYIVLITPDLDDDLDEAKKKAKKKNPPLNKPKRGGSKKFYVYVRKPGGGIKKVSFGQAGMSAKINNPEARRAFAARHKCSQKTDKTKASYWSCRLPRYAHLLGLKSKFSGFW